MRRLTKCLLTGAIAITPFLGFSQQYKGKYFSSENGNETIEFFRRYNMKHPSADLDENRKTYYDNESGKFRVEYYDDNGNLLHTARYRLTDVKSNNKGMILHPGNRNRSTLEKITETSAAVVGSYMLIKGLVELFGGNSNKREHYVGSNEKNTYRETEDLYNEDSEGFFSEGGSEGFFSEGESGGFFSEGNSEKGFLDGGSSIDYAIKVDKEQVAKLDSVIVENGLEKLWNENVEKAEKAWGESDTKSEETRKVLAYLLSKQLPGGSVMIKGDMILHKGVDNWWAEQAEKKNGLFGDCGELKEGSSIWEEDPECYPETNFQRNMKTGLYTAGENVPITSQIIDLLEWGMKAEEDLREKIEENK